MIDSAGLGQKLTLKVEERVMLTKQARFDLKISQYTDQA